MSLDAIINTLTEVRQTNVTETVHAGPYDAISPTRPELNQAGKNILITGGGTGVGLAIAKAFVQASASTVIIVGRRADVLETARKTLEDDAKSDATETKIIAKACDVSKNIEVDALWKYLEDEKITIDVFVANAAVFQEAGTMMNLGSERIWEMMEINMKAPMYLAEKFVNQPGDTQKVNLMPPSIRHFVADCCAIVHRQRHDGQHPRHPPPRCIYFPGIHAVQDGEYVVLSVPSAGTCA